MTFQKSKLAYFAAFPVLLALVLFCLPKTAHAAYNASDLIDNVVFTNVGSMNQGQIQSFLSGKGGYLAGYSSFSGRDGGNVPASQIIAEAASDYGINPQAIMATLQKEQSLITDPSPSASQLNCAMGYLSCDGSHNSFYSQVDAGTWQLRYSYEASSGRAWGGHAASEYPCKSATSLYSAGLYPGNTVTFYDPGGSARTITLANAATASLYCYTPYVGPLSQTGYSGSYNFVISFESWFGSTLSSCVFPDKVDHGIYRLYNMGTGNQLLTTDPYEVCAATGIGWLYDGQILQEASSQGLPVYRLEKGGRYLFTTSTAERDSAINSYGFRLEGIAFSAVDPSVDPSEARAVYRLVNPNGTYVYTISGYERDMLTSYGYTYEGIDFYLLENLGTSVTSAYRLSNPNGTYFYTISSSEKNNAAQTYGYNYEGVGFQAITQLNAISVPVYRLAGRNTYLLTTNLQERVDAIRHGYRNEGISMFTYGTMSDPSLHNLYRLSSKSGSFFYTTSDTERDAAIQNYGYTLNGISFLTP